MAAQPRGRAPPRRREGELRPRRRWTSCYLDGVRASSSHGTNWTSSGYADARGELWGHDGATHLALDLAGLLVSRGLRITVVATLATAPLLAPLLDAHHGGAVQALILAFPSHPALPTGVESAKDSPPMLFASLIVAFAELRGPLGSWVRERSDTPGRVVAILADLEGSAFVSNTFRRLEERYLRALLADLGARRIHAVEPVASGPEATGDRGGEAAVSTADLFPDDSSVLYISFGSMAVLQLPHACGGAGLRAGAQWVAFVWAAGKTAPVPEGFEERVAAAGGRGRVIRGWASQVAALRHWAVGWFVTHCGWNTVLEAAAAGVAMLTWPMTADQFVNAWLLVDELGAAVPVSWGGLKAAPAADNVARVLHMAIGGNHDMVARAKEIAAEAAAAIREGGDSWRELEELVRELASEAITKTVSDY